jgi:hypothetical protein
VIGARPATCRASRARALRCGAGRRAGRRAPAAAGRPLAAADRRLAWWARPCTACCASTPTGPCPAGGPQEAGERPPGRCAAAAGRAAWPGRWAAAASRRPGPAGRTRAGLAAVALALAVMCARPWCRCTAGCCR